MSKIHKILLTSTAGIAALAATASIASAAGNVTVTVSGGQLIVTGDSADNSVVIAGTMQTNAYQVSSGDGVTTINGGLAPVVSGVSNREIFFEFESGGVDDVTVNNATFTRQVSATFGEVGGSFTLNGVVINKFLRLTMGDGENNVDFTDTQISEKSKMSLGDGIDTVTFDNVEYRGGIFTKDGDDTVLLIDSEHTDPNGKLIVKTGNGLDAFELTNANWEGKILVNLGSDNDTCVAGTIDVGVKVKISGAADTDTLTNNGGHTGAPEFVAFE